MDLKPVRIFIPHDTPFAHKTTNMVGGSTGAGIFRQICLAGSLRRRPIRSPAIGPVRVMTADQSSPPRRRRSSSGGRSRPRLVSGGAKVPEGGSADQAGLEVEDVVDCGMGGEELLGRGSGLELLLLSLPPPDRQVGVFGAVVLLHPSWLVAISQAQIPSCGAIRSQFVGDNGLGADALGCCQSKIDGGRQGHILCRMTQPQSPFRYFNSSPEIIRLVVLMYVKYPLSLRNLEDLLAERGIDICHETVRFWWNRFGPMFRR